MTEIQTKPFWLIRNWNLDIICELVLEDWCFSTPNLLNFLHHGPKKIPDAFP